MIIESAIDQTDQTSQVENYISPAAADHGKGGVAGRGSDYA